MSLSPVLELVHDADMHSDKHTLSLSLSFYLSFFPLSHTHTHIQKDSRLRLVQDTEAGAEKLINDRVDSFIVLDLLS